MKHRWTVYANKDKFRDVTQQITDFVARAALEEGKPQLVTVEPLHQARRSDAQNRFMWPLMQQMADCVNITQQSKDAYITKEHMKTYCVRRFFGVDKRLIMGEEVVADRSTRKMTKAEMMHLIDSTMELAAEQGFSVMVPPDYHEWARE